MALAIKFRNFNRPISSCYTLLNTTLHQKALCNSRKASTKSVVAESKQALINFKYLRLIKKAIRENGPIIEKNKKLSSLLETASKIKIDPEILNYTTKAAVNARACVGLFEMVTFNNCYFIVQYDDIDNSITKHHLLTLCNKYDSYLIFGNTKWLQYFDQKGIVTVRCENIPQAESEKNLATQIGAQSVTKETDFDGLTYWKFHCDPSVLQSVKHQLSNKNFEMEEAYVGYVSKNTVNLHQSMKNVLHNIIVDLHKIPCIDNVYTNVM